MSLNEAQPSVLGHASREPNSHRAAQTVVRTISAPRTVYAKFEDGQSNEESDPEFCSDHATSSADAPATTSSSLICIASCNTRDGYQDAARPPKVQFEDSRNRVTTYTLSPTASPTAERVPNQQQTSHQNEACDSSLWKFENEVYRQGTAEEELHSGGISRCASNLGARAGTFNELMADASRPAPTKMQCMPSSDGYQVVNIPDSDPQPSRCASNMSTRAGTFNEITADQIVAHPLSLVDSILDNSTMLSYTSLGNQHSSRCPPTRRVSNMICCAGTFEEVLDSSEMAVDNELFDGTISRRATNMHTAAGAFEELVDEDGDELGPEEDSCSSMTSGVDIGGNNISLSGMISSTGVVHDTASDAEPAPLILFDDARQEPHQQPAVERGSEHMLHFAPAAGIEQGLGASDCMNGVLPSDGCEEVDESGVSNPLANADLSLDAFPFDTCHTGTNQARGPVPLQADSWYDS